MSDGSIFTCQNHQDLRWFNTKPGGRLVFMGQITEDGKLKPAHAIAPIPHVDHLKARLNGKNPFSSDLESEPLTDWAEVLEFVDYLREQDKRWAFECSCPGLDLIRVEDESYESIHDLEEATPPTPEPDWIVIASEVDDGPITPAAGPFETHEEALAWATEAAKSGGFANLTTVDVMQILKPKKEHQ